MVGLFLYICICLNFVYYFYLDMQNDSRRVEKINTVEINNLWGRYHFKWELNDDVNILVGINGSGKTTIFRIIENIFNEPYLNVLLDEYNGNDFHKKMKFSSHQTKVEIRFNNTEQLIGDEQGWGTYSVEKISNLNTFDVPISMSRAERILKNFDNADPRLRMRTLLEIGLEDLIFRKEKQKRKKTDNFPLPISKIRVKSLAFPTFPIMEKTNSIKSKLRSMRNYQICKAFILHKKSRI